MASPSIIAPVGPRQKDGDNHVPDYRVLVHPKTAGQVASNLGWSVPPLSLQEMGPAGIFGSAAISATVQSSTSLRTSIPHTSSSTSTSNSSPPSSASQQTPATRTEVPSSEVQAIKGHEAQLQRTVTAVAISVALLIGLAVIYAAYRIHRRLRTQNSQLAEPTPAHTEDRRSYRTKANKWHLPFSRKSRSTHGVDTFDGNLEAGRRTRQDNERIAPQIAWRSDVDDPFADPRPVSITSSPPSYSSHA